MATAVGEETGAITIQMTGGIAGRLFGLPFLLVGGWLASQVVGAVTDLVTGRAAGAQMAAGLLVLMVVTAAFLIPGWMLVCARGRVVIDRTSGTLTAVRDYRVYQHREQRRLSEFTRLAVDMLTTASNPRRRAKPAFQIELVAATGSNVLVGLADDASGAMDLGRRLGALLGLPVEDLRYADRLTGPARGE
jgi:hypothetical protein